jgi:hypothetical protein
VSDDPHDDGRWSFQNMQAVPDGHRTAGRAGP